jgi:hypothetical protein
VARAAYLVGGRWTGYEPEPELPFGAGEPLPVGGAPWPFEPDPMSGQFRVEPEPVLVPEPVLDVGLDVVAALATNAPPVRRPAVNAPTASTLRTRSCIWRYAFRLW